jgi:hypothetical protein
VHRGPDRRGAEVDVGVVGIVRDAEREAGRIHLQTASHQIEAGGKGEAVALGADEAPVGLEGPQARVCERTLLAPDARPAQQVGGGDRRRAPLDGGQQAGVEGGVLV